MNEKNDRGFDENPEDDETQKQHRSSDPERTPGQAEGTVEDVNEALRRQQERLRREH